ncbi:hypothetical protein RchiOBHm_Chr6g0272801 [Rosa chinensis]|uniref:Uncharacterized protein n=1 Tax=Rosa chinensis TaxID=74649 RepID=A0A2P6PRB8_ROSCH|nr:hypothetical protein RchiOBHm_Chr6g0272801 [Rosa chinensis]
MSVRPLLTKAIELWQNLKSRRLDLKIDSTRWQDNTRRLVDNGRTTIGSNWSLIILRVTHCYLFKYWTW